MSAAARRGRSRSSSATRPSSVRGEALLAGGHATCSRAAWPGPQTCWAHARRRGCPDVFFAHPVTPRSVPATSSTNSSSRMVAEALPVPAGPRWSPTRARRRGVEPDDAQDDSRRCSRRMQEKLDHVSKTTDNSERAVLLVLATAEFRSSGGHLSLPKRSSKGEVAFFVELGGSHIPFRVQSNCPASPFDRTTADAKRCNSREGLSRRRGLELREARGG